MSVYAIACLVASVDKRAVRLRMWGLILLAAVLGAVACAGFSNKGSSPGTLLALDAQTVYRVQTSWVSEDADADGVVNGADNCPAWPGRCRAAAADVSPRDRCVSRPCRTMTTRRCGRRGDASRQGI